MTPNITHVYLTVSSWHLGKNIFEHFKIFATTWHALLHLTRIATHFHAHCDEFFPHWHAKLRAMALPFVVPVWGLLKTHSITSPSRRRRRGTVSSFVKERSSKSGLDRSLTLLLQECSCKKWNSYLKQTWQVSFECHFLSQWHECYLYDRNDSALAGTKRLVKDRSRKSGSIQERLTELGARVSLFVSSVRRDDTTTTVVMKRSE